MREAIFGVRSSAIRHDVGSKSLRVRTARATIIGEATAELVMFARDTQIPSSEFARALAGICINTHDSFLPGFRGADPPPGPPARRKIVSATARYVSEGLEERPIIEEGAERVEDAMSPEELIAAGRDIECSVQVRAVRWHAKRRVLIGGQRTIVFRWRAS